MIYNNFVSDYLDKRATIDEIDDYVKYWHTHETGLSLQDFLGFTDEDMAKWMMYGNDVVKDIILDKMNKNAKADKK